METVRPAKKSETIFTKLLATIMLCVLGTLIFVNAMKGIMILNFDINEGITSYYDSSVAFNLATQYAHNAAEAYFNNYEFHGDLGYNYRVEKNTEEGLVLVAENRHLAQTARDYAFGAWQDENNARPAAAMMSEYFFIPFPPDYSPRNGRSPPSSKPGASREPQITPSWHNSSA